MTCRSIENERPSLSLPKASCLLNTVKRHIGLSAAEIDLCNTLRAESDDKEVVEFGNDLTSVRR